MVLLRKSIAELWALLKPWFAPNVRGGFSVFSESLCDDLFHLCDVKYERSLKIGRTSSR